MVVLWARDGYYCANAIGAHNNSADLTAWDNAQVKLAVAELNAIDWFYSASITHTKPRTININPMTAGHIPKRMKVGRILGRLSTTHYVQTAIMAYMIYGKCITTEATPNIHAITKDTVTTPCRLAFHYEKEGTTASRRKDPMGFVPLGLDTTCSERATVAFQTYTGNFAISVAADDLAQPTPFTQAIHHPYNWFHYKDASSASSFLYNNAAINVDIVEFNIHEGWGSALFGPYDVGGYPADGHVVPPFNTYIDLGVRLTDAGGTGIDTIADTVHTSYTGDLDLIIDFYESATRYFKRTFDDMYVVPDSYEEMFKAEGDWYDGAKFRLAFRNETASAVIEEKNALNNDYYENPA